MNLACSASTPCAVVFIQLQDGNPGKIYQSLKTWSGTGGASPSKGETERERERERERQRERNRDTHIETGEN